MILFDVSYYNEEHKRLLAKTPFADRLNSLVANGLQLKEEEFWAYAVFKHQKDRHAWRTYDNLKSKLPSFRPSCEEYFDTTQKTVRSRFSGNESDKPSAEAMAVGASLGLLSTALDLHEADWEKIDESQVQDLDFQIAATTSEIIELESKGCVTNQDGLTPISGKRAEIASKKHTQRQDGNRNRLIGVITTFPETREGKAHCYLLDPPSFPEIVDPRTHKLIARLLFYLREVKLIIAARFLIALVNRINDLAHIGDIDALDSIPLMDVDGEPYWLAPILCTRRCESRINRYRCVLGTT